MILFALAFGLSLLLASVATPLITALAHHRGLLDAPTEARKVHVVPTPRLGGVAVMLAVATTLGFLGWGSATMQSAIAGQTPFVCGAAAGIGAIWLLGLADDLFGLGARQKFAVEVAVGVLVWIAGFRIESLGLGFGPSLPLGLASLPVTVFWMVAVSNAVNLIDGLDGLASGLALIAATVLFAVAAIEGNLLLCLLLAAYGGALVGFLFFNFNPARIFLGDSGSLTLGFMLALATVWTHKQGSGAVAALWLPLLVLAVPLLDTSLAILRRLARKQSPFAPDREHLHHRLLTLGHSHRATVLIVYLVAVAFALGAFNTLVGSPAETVGSAVGVCAILTLLLYRVGLLGARRAHDLPVRARLARRTIRNAADFDSAWEQFAALLPEIGCEHARLELRIREGKRHTRPRTFEWEGTDAVRQDQGADVLQLPVSYQRRKFGSLTVALQPVHEEEEVSLRSQTLDSLREALAARSLREARTRARSIRRERAG